MKRPRVLFLGQKPLAEAAWARLRRADTHGIDVVAVGTNVAADAGWWGSNTIAAEAGVPVVDTAPRSSSEAIARLVRELRVEWILSIQHPWILPAGVLAQLEGRAINFHSARLPSYGGNHAFTHALLNGDAEFACTAHWMVERVDAGDAAYEGAFAVEPEDTSASLWAKAHHVTLALLDRVLGCLTDGKEPPRRPLSGTPRFYDRRSIEPHREIRGLGEAAVKARAFFFPPFEPAYVRDGARRLHVLPAVAHAHLAAGVPFGRPILERMVEERAAWDGYTVSS